MTLANQTSQVSNWFINARRRAPGKEAQRAEAQRAEAHRAESSGAVHLHESS